jgi:hypothetical protein
MSRQTFRHKPLQDHGWIYQGQNTKRDIRSNAQRRHRRTSSPPLLRALFPRPPAPLNAHPSPFTNRRSRPSRRRAVHFLRTHPGNSMDAPRRPTNKQTRRDNPRQHSQHTRRPTLLRARILGPSKRPRANRSSRPKARPRVSARRQ